MDIKGVLTGLIVYLFYSCLPVFAASTNPYDFCTYGSQFVSSKAIADLCKLHSSGHVDFNVLGIESSKSCKKSVILVGENHHDEIVDPKLQASIKNFISQFPVRAFEMVQKSHPDISRVRGLKEFDSNHRGDKWTLKKQLISWGWRQEYLAPRDFFRRDGITLAYKHEPVENITIDNIPSNHVLKSSLTGHSIESHYKDTILKISRDKKISPNNLIATARDPELFIDRFGELMWDFHPFSINIPIEYGDLDSYEIECGSAILDCGNYLFEQREQRMIRNIKSIIDKMPCGETLPVVVGNKHIFGLTLRLMTDGFQGRTNVSTVSTKNIDWYNKFSDLDYSDLLQKATNGTAEAHSVSAQ